MTATKEYEPHSYKEDIKNLDWAISGRFNISVELQMIKLLRRELI